MSPLSGRVVLVALDDGELRKRTVHVLARAGAIVRPAASASDALGIVQVDHVDAVVCDETCSEGEPRHWIEAMRTLADPQKRRVAVLAIGRADGRAAAPGRGRTFDDRMAPPIHTRELITRVVQMVTPVATRRLPTIDGGAT